ncbi:MAG TPA: DUF58 domain-containing protein [Pseudonocardiaceae bacterium]|jgi:uncharacterized protein (DUF58 family)|nr:DUF58 domain-containing protein [Pseudonocardiaceae bacterium]
MRGALAGLTTRGRCLLAAGIAAALCSAVLNERDLLRVAVFVIALPLLGAALAATSRVGLSARRTVVTPRVPAGEQTEVVLEINATGRIPSGGLLLEDGVPYTLGGRPRFVVERLRRRNTVRLGYQLRPTMRGVHNVGPLRGRITDPFGLAEFERELAARSRVVVIPRVMRLTGLPGGSGQGAGDDGSIRLRSGQGEDDAIVRQYRQGDDLRRVHWRSTARRDELMVRVEERPWRGGITVLLDRRGPAHRGTGPTSSLEWAISLCASVCLHLHHVGHQVRLVTEDAVTVAGEHSDTGHSDDVVLDGLASLQVSQRRDFSAGTDPGEGFELIAIFGALDATGAAELARSRIRRPRSLAVLLDVNRWSSEDRPYDPAEAAGLLRDAGWGVVIARPDVSMNNIWTDLCRIGSVRGRTMARGIQ